MLHSKQDATEARRRAAAGEGDGIPPQEEEGQGQPEGFDQGEEESGGEEEMEEDREVFEVEDSEGEDDVLEM